MILLRNDAIVLTDLCTLRQSILCILWELCPYHNHPEGVYRIYGNILSGKRSCWQAIELIAFDKYRTAERELSQQRLLRHPEGDPYEAKCSAFLRVDTT